MHVYVHVYTLGVYVYVHPCVYTMYVFVLLTCVYVQGSYVQANLYPIPLCYTHVRMCMRMCLHSCMCTCIWA